jgi:hypothetical protein
MRRLWDFSGLALAPLVLAGLALAGEAKAPAKKEAKPGCGQHGTRIDFVESPKEAAKQAKDEKKLVLVLHVSGDFEDPRFT